MCVCKRELAMRWLGPQENFNLPVDPCDGATANFQPHWLNLQDLLTSKSIFFCMLHGLEFNSPGLPSDVTVIGRMHTNNPLLLVGFIPIFLIWNNATVKDKC